MIGDAVLGAEVRAGTFHFTWLSPTPSWQIVARPVDRRLVVALVTIAPGRRPRRRRRRRAERARPGVRSRPPSVASAYLAVLHRHRVRSRGAPRCGRWRSCSWSNACSGPPSTGIAQLSPTWESRAIFVGLIDDVPRRLVREGIPAGWGAVVRLAIVTLVVLALANWRMRHLRLSGAAD